MMFDMKKWLLYGLFAMAFACVGCADNPKTENSETVSVENDDKVIAEENDSSVVVKTDSIVVEEVARAGKPGEVSDTVISGVKFRIYRYHFTSKDFEKTITFTLPMLDNASVQDEIWKNLLKDSYESKDLDNKLEDEFASYWEEYSETAGQEANPYSSEEFYSMSWNIEPKFVEAGCVAFSSGVWEMFGGAMHPEWGSANYLFSLSTGDLITEDDILDKSEESRYAVARKLYSLLKKYLDEEDDGDDVDVSMMLNGNFSFTKDELVYSYEPYEVAYYAAGEPVLSLSKDWLKPYLKVDGLLYKYWFEK
jgi:hypothetical protein